MTTDFLVVSGTTVPPNYIWDIGTPLETVPTNIVAESTTEYISGYAPSLKVVFKSDIRDLIYAGTENVNVSSTYIWNFGDYYNSASNEVVFKCNDSTVEHTYILPGKYNVSLINIQSKEDQPDEFSPNTIKCLGKHDIGWQWENLESALGPGGLSRVDRTTWDEAMCVPPLTAVKKRPKWWSEEGECFQKHCYIWNWNDLKVAGRNPVFWFQVYRYGDYAKRWQYEVNDFVCDVEGLPEETVETTEQITVKTAIVEVKEVMPVASIFNETLPLTGYSPFAFRLSPIHTKTGSFPIDRIDWEPGDGSSIKTVTRYTEPNSKYFVRNNAYFSDPLDPRNYDFVYTIIRNSNTYPVFYPSITCYSAGTNSYDSCSIVVGPILLEPQTQDIQIVKAKNTTKGDFYGIEIGNNITILSTLTSTNSQTSIIPNKPSAPVKQIVENKPIIYFGNTGEGYPPPFIPSCEQYTASESDLFYLTTEDGGTSALFLEDTTLLYKY